MNPVMISRIMGSVQELLRVLGQWLTYVPPLPTTMPEPQARSLRGAAQAVQQQLDALSSIIEDHTRQVTTVGRSPSSAEARLAAATSPAPRAEGLTPEEQREVERQHREERAAATPGSPLPPRTEEEQQLHERLTTPTPPKPRQR